MNGILSNIKTRRSIRKFKNEPVSRESLEKIIEAGLYAPSGMNRQPVLIISVTRKDMRDRLSRMNREIGGWNADFDPFYGAPAVLIVLAKKDAPTCIYDGSAALQNMLLAAHALGLGACWIHRAKEEFSSPEGREILANLGITEEYEGIGHCIVGHPDQEPEAAPRKPHRVFFLE